MQAPVEHAHELILVGGLLGLLSIFAGLVSARVNAPLLLVFLVVGMLAGEDGPGGILFSDFRASYLIGSIALAAILFEGGFKTSRSMLREGAPSGERLFGIAFGTVVASLVVQGWTIRQAAALLGFSRAEG